MAKLIPFVGQKQLMSCQYATSHLDNGIEHSFPSPPPYLPPLTFSFLSFSTFFSPNHSHPSFLD